MEPENRQVTTAAPAAPTAGPTYPTLLLRLWLVRARLRARAKVRAVRPYASADDRRLAAVLVAAGVAVVTLLGCVVAGFAATTCVVVTAVGFFVPLGGGLALLLGPDDYDCEAELAEVTGLLPEAKRAWDERRAASRAARAARKAARAARSAARKAERVTRRQAGQVARNQVAAARTQGGQVARPQAAAARVSAPRRPAAGADLPVAEELVEPDPGYEPDPGPAVLEGDGAYAVPVLGEVHVGRILADVCHNELPAVGQDRVVPAVVRIEDAYRDDPAAAVVEIAGRRVGHLSRADARALWRRAGHDGTQFECRVAIRAGWKHGRVCYDLRLDANLGADRPSGVVGR